MEFLDVVEQRRAVREYRPAEVARSLIGHLIDIAALAPSAMNLQPWAFAVITGTTRIDGYARRAKEYLIANPLALPLTQEMLQMLQQPNFSVFYRAPVLLLVLATSNGEQSREDCCLAAQTLLLAARDAGLGTCWIGFGRPWLDSLETKRELGLPESYRVVAPIVMGPPKAWPEPHGRKAAEVHWLS